MTQDRTDKTWGAYPLPITVRQDTYLTAQASKCITEVKKCFIEAFEGKDFDLKGIEIILEQVYNAGYNKCSSDRDKLINY